LPDHVYRGEAQIFRDCSYLMIRHADLSLTAAIGASGAINLFLNGPAENPKRSIRIVVGVQVSLES